MNIFLSFSKHCWQYPILVALHEKARSSLPGVFCKKGVFKNFANHGTPPVAASEKLKEKAVVRRCSVKKLFYKILLNSQENTCARVSFLQP